MPRFFLHVRNGDGFTRDEDGADFPDPEAARAEAIRSARSMMADELHDGQMNLGACIDVEDENHERLFTVPFSEAVEIRH